MRTGHLEVAVLRDDVVELHLDGVVGAEAPDEQPGGDQVPQDEGPYLVVAGRILEPGLMRLDVGGVELEEAQQVVRVLVDLERREDLELLRQEPPQEPDVDARHDDVHHGDRIGRDRDAVDEERERPGETEDPQFDDRLLRE